MAAALEAFGGTLVAVRRLKINFDPLQDGIIRRARRHHLRFTLGIELDDGARRCAKGILGSPRQRPLKRGERVGALRIIGCQRITRKSIDRVGQIGDTLTGQEMHVFKSAQRRNDRQGRGGRESGGRRSAEITPGAVATRHHGYAEASISGNLRRGCSKAQESSDFLDADEHVGVIGHGIGPGADQRVGEVRDFGIKRGAEDRLKANDTQDEKKADDRERAEHFHQTETLQSPTWTAWVMMAHKHS